MGWIEFIELRSFSPRDRKAAKDAFQHLSWRTAEQGLQEIALFEDPSLDEELIIAIQWNKEVAPHGTSRLGTQLASGFSEFGHVHHFGWRLSFKRIFQSRATSSEER